MPLDSIRDRFPTEPEVDLGGKSARQYMDAYDTRNISYGSPYDQKDLGRVGQGLSDAYMSSIMELPMMAMEYLMPDDPYEAGVLQSGPQDRMREGEFKWQEHMESQAQDPSYATGQDFGQALGVIADPFIDAPLMGIPALGKMMKLSPDTTAKTTGGLMGQLLDETGAIKAYHGTPHEVDKFRMANIGTGEGAQAYGHGLYFAEDKGVANYYKTVLEGENKVIYPDGTEMLDSEFGDFTTRYASDYLRKSGNDYSKAIELVKEDGGVYKDEIIEWIDVFKKQDAKVNTGSTYEVDLDVNPEDLLDWDAPLSEQSEKVRGMVESLPQDAKELLFQSNPILDRLRKNHRQKAEPHGNDIYRTLSRHFGSESNATTELGGLNVKGIRYLDGSSRSAGEGSRNVVMFDEDLINIVGRE